MKGCEWYVINNDELRKQLNTALRAIDSLTKERDEARGWLEKISQPRLRRGLGDIRILKEIGYDYSAQVLEAVDDYLSSQGTFIPL